VSCLRRQVPPFLGELKDKNWICLDGRPIKGWVASHIIVHCNMLIGESVSNDGVSVRIDSRKVVTEILNLINCVCDFFA
jgi:hypothetical protein